jgi:hypothetical protein
MSEFLSLIVCVCVCVCVLCSRHILTCCGKIDDSCVFESNLANPLLVADTVVTFLRTREVKSITILFNGNYGTENVILILYVTKPSTICHHECSVCFELRCLLRAHLLK